MRHRILAIVLAVLLCAGGFVSGALPDNTTTWELRSLGANTNGGCYVTGASGTDFSQQAAAQFSGTDLVLATTTTVTSVSHAFVATDVGNCIQITAGTGFTPGFYNIVSVAAGTATLGAAAGAMGSVGGTWAEGGALASPVIAAANITHGNTIYCKADGTYTMTASVIYQADGNGFQPTRTIGYTTTRGDNGRCSWTTSTNALNLVLPNTSGAVANRDYSFYNLNLSSTAGSPGDGWSTTSRQVINVLFDNCLFDGFLRSLHGDAGVTDSFTPLVLSNVEVRNSKSQGINNSAPVYCFGCYVHDNAAQGLLVENNYAGIYQTVVVASIFFGNGVSATVAQIELNDNTGQNGRGLALWGVDVAGGGAEGVKLNTINQAIPFQSFNSVYYNNATYGINNTGTVGPDSYVARNNAFGANGTAATHNLPATDIGTVTLSANPFTSSTDFSLNSTAGGGTLLKGTGWPGTLIGGGTGHLDIGALQSSGGGAGGAFSFGVSQ
jgi:hypothetical protein